MKYRPDQFKVKRRKGIGPVKSNQIKARLAVLASLMDETKSARPRNVPGRVG